MNNSVKNLFEYFELSDDASNDNLINEFEKENDLIFSEEYKFVLSRLAHSKPLFLPFYFEVSDSFQRQHNYTWVTLYTFSEVLDSFKNLSFLEKESRRWYEGFNSYNAKGLVPIASISGDSDIDQLYINCSELDNGSIYILDIRLYCAMDKNGNPVKLRLANDLTDFVERSKEMRLLMSKEFLGCNR